MSAGTDLHCPVALLYYNCHQEKYKFGPLAKCGFDSSLLSPSVSEDGAILFLVLAGNLQSCVGTIKLVRDLEVPCQERIVKQQ